MPSIFIQIKSGGSINRARTFEVLLVCKIFKIKNLSDCRKRLKPKGIARTDSLTEGDLQTIIFVGELIFTDASSKVKK